MRSWNRKLPNWKSVVARRQTYGEQVCGNQNEEVAETKATQKKLIDKSKVKAPGRRQTDQRHWP